MSNKEIEDFGYDYFIGRVIFKDSEDYVTLDLHSLGSGGYTTLEQACDDLCEYTSRGERVLLTKSPGREGPKTRSASEMNDIISEAIQSAKRETQSSDIPMVIDQSSEETFTTSGRRYEPFKPEQMTLLQSMYYARPEMQKFPDPFLIQPPNKFILTVKSSHNETKFYYQTS